MEHNAVEPVLAIMANNPGTWGNEISIDIITDLEQTRLANSFIVVVYYRGNEVERFQGSLTEMNDGYGQPIFIERRNSTSRYVTFKVNTENRSKK